MIIEDISKDEVTLKNENSRFFKKRIKVGLHFYNGKSYIEFNRENNEYEIWLSEDQPEDLWESYELLHEAHHLQKELMFPKWMAGEVFRIDKANLPTLNLERILNNAKDNYEERFSCLNECLKKELLNALENAFIHFHKHVRSYGDPQHIGLLNAFEDIAIESHINHAHPEIGEFQSEMEKRIETYSFITLDQLIESLEGISKIIKQISGGFSLLFTIPFTSRGELEDFYTYYDLGIWFPSEKLTPESYYQIYYYGLKRVMKKLPRKAFADRYRAKLELERIKNILKKYKKTKFLFL